MLKFIIGKIAKFSGDEIPLTEVLVRELLPKDVLEDLESVNRTDEVIDELANNGTFFEGYFPWEVPERDMTASQFGSLLQQQNQFAQQQMGGIQNAGLAAGLGRIAGMWNT